MPQTRKVDRRNRIVRQVVFAEVLESRQLLSAVTNPLAQPVDISPSFESGSTTPTGLSPAQIDQAYGINAVSFNGTAGTGQGQTIAIVAAYDNPEFVDTGSAGFANSDLHKFDVAMGINDPPSFTKVDQTGGTNYPSVDPNPTNDSDWENEIALDVEWTHAIAPAANIVLVEANSTALSDLIGAGAHYAATIPGVSVVTMSFSVGEFSFETNYDSYLETPENHQGVTFVAASGDDGDLGGYPAMSPNVTAVGATTLTLSNGNYSSETGHNTSGGGISQYETKPSFQYNTDKSDTFRTTPDVSFDGDPNTGVSVYDSYNGGSQPWYKIGGTSFCSPAWAGLIAIANQGRVQLGLGTLDGPNQTNSRLYSLNSADYHDITTGSNGFSAGPGYDLVTGLGSPIANKLIPDLAGGNSVSGTFFNDANGNGQQDSGESGIGGDIAFVDLAHSGTLNGVDPNISSSPNGEFNFSDLPGGTYRITQNTPAGATLTDPSSTYYTVTLGYGSTITGDNFGYQSSNTAEKLAFVQQPTTVAVGAVISPAITVEVEDALGNIVSGSTSAVTLALSGGGSTLGGTLTENAVGGIATFSNITISTAGSATITASDTGLSSALSNTITVSTGSTTPLVPAKLIFAQQPTGTTAGNIITPAVTVLVEDANGNQVTTDTSAVTLTIGAGAATLGGSVTVNAIGGVATFANLIITAAETTKFTATDGSLTQATSNTITITPAPVVPIIPAQVVVAQQPTSTQIGSPISPAITVEVRDSNGRLVTTDTSAVTLSIASGTATLGGTLTVNAVAGVATFSDITVSAAGNYTLKATDGQLNSAISKSFSVAVPGTIVPTIVHSTVPATGIGGSKLHATVLVSNLANATAVGNVTANIYASDNGALTLLGTVTKMMSVKSGKTYSVSVPIKLLPTTLVGTYSLVARTVDTSGNYISSALGSSITVAAPVVVFSEIITKTTLPTAVVAGSASKATALVKITNSGNIASSGMTTVGIYASTDGSTTGATLIASLVRKLVIQPKGSAVVSIPLKLIPSALDGGYTILAEVTNLSAADSSTNSGVMVNIAPPFVTLSSSMGLVTPSTLAAGKSVSITVTLTNTGNIDSVGAATINVGLSSDGTTELPGSTTTMRTVKIASTKTFILHLKFAVPTTTTAGDYFPFVSFTQAGKSTQVIGTSALTVT